MIQLPKLSTGQTLLDIPTSEKKIWNVVSQSFENCKSENLFLVRTLDTCKSAIEKANISIRSKDVTIDRQELLIANLEYTVELQKGITKIDLKLEKERKTAATWKTIGFTLGGFGFGVLVPVLIVLFK